jgi:hypothetical protein
MTESGKGKYTKAPDGKRPATSAPDSPYVKPDLGKGKGPAQPKTTDRPRKDAKADAVRRKPKKK